jgi:hypothetical protein
MFRCRKLWGLPLVGCPRLFIQCSSVQYCGDNRCTSSFRNSNKKFEKFKLFSSMTTLHLHVLNCPRSHTVSWEQFSGNEARAEGLYLCWVFRKIYLYVNMNIPNHCNWSTSVPCPFLFNRLKHTEKKNLNFSNIVQAYLSCEWCLQ